MQSEALRQKWVVDMVMGVEAAYREIILDLNDEQVHILGLDVLSTRQSFSCTAERVFLQMLSS
jgi:hypothetical protein